MELRLMMLNKIVAGMFFCLSLVGCQDNPEEEITPNKEVAVIVTQSDLKADSNRSQKKALPSASASLKLLDISEREVGKVNAIELLFNAPLNADQNFERFIETSPTLASPVLSEDGKRLQFVGIKPDTHYAFNIIAGLIGENGKTLLDSKQQSVNTRAMQAVVSFKSEKGAILVPGHSDDLGIYSVNTAEADLNIYRVKADHLTRFIKQFKQIANSGAYYYQNANREEMVEHIYTARIKTGAQANQRHVTKFPLTNKKWANESGVYLATLGKPGSFEFNAATWFSISAIGLQVRQFPHSSYIFTHDIKTGAPLENVQVDLLDKHSHRYASLTSDKAGRVEVKNHRQLSLIVARNGEQVTVLPYQNPRFDLSDFNVGGRPHSEHQIFVYSERDIYRPGEVITLSVLSRDSDGQVQNSDLSVELFKPDGSAYKSVWLKATDKQNGYYQYTVSLPKSSPVGNWQAKVKPKGNNNYVARFHFKVEEFLPERLRLTLGEPGKLTSFSPVKNSKDEVLKVKVLGEYLYGAPASGNTLKVNGSISPWATPFAQWPEYYVGDSDATKRTNFELEDIKLNAVGEHISQVSQSWQNWDMPSKIRLNYSLFESGGRAINRSHDSLLWPKSSYIAVKPGFKDDQSASDDEIHFSLLKLDKEGQALSQGNVKVELIREEKRYFWTYNSSNGWHYERIEKEYSVDSRTLTIVDRSPLVVAQQVEWGDYRLELTDLSSTGKTIYRFRAGQAWYNDWQNNSATIRPDRVNLALDKSRYLPGEALTLRLGAPTAGNALITIESDKVLYQQQVIVPKGESEVKLAVPEGVTRHDLYISAFVISPSSTHAESVSKRSFGIIYLPLDRTNRALDIAIDVPERWTPNQQVFVKIIAKDAQGKPLSGNAKVTLSAVDAGVLSVSGYKVEDPHQFFYGQRAYQGAISDVYDQVMTPLLADDAEIRWGGDAALTRGGEKADSEVQIVSLFSGLVSLSDGIAEIPLQLPAFDGELNLTALAFDEAQFAKTEKSITVASPVVVQISMPKFLASGDSSEVALDLTNVTDEIIKAELLWQVKGKLMAQNSQKVMNLKPNEKQTLYFKLNAQQDIGIGDIEAKMKLGDEVIKRSWKLPIRATQPDEFHSLKALLMPGDSFTLPTDALDLFNESSKKLQLSVGLTPNLDAKAHWQYLTQYPYGCLEQTTSKSRPFAAVLSKNGKSVSINNLTTNRISIKEIQAKAQGAIERYSELQRADGSFGLWSKTSTEQHWLTAYATEFLYDLKAKGVAVPDKMLDEATQRLQSYLSSRSRHHVKTWSSNPQHYDAAYRAYAAYVLAKQNSVTLGPLRDIAEKDMQAAIGKLPGVHLGLAMLMAGSEKEGNALIHNALLEKRGDQYLGDYGSALRDQAMVINALLTTTAVNKELKQIALKMLPDLASAMQQKRWLSTQERSAILLLAMTIEQQYTQQKWQASLALNGQTEPLSVSGEYHKNIQPIDDLVAVFKNVGEQPLYASFDWSGVKTEPDYHLQHGIRITTEHFLVKDNNGTKSATKLSENSTLQSGDLLLTRLRLRSVERVPDALLVNLMPAGLELENQNLNNSLKLAEIDIEGQSIANAANIAHQEYRDDRYIAAVDLPAQQIQTLYVLSRAVNPGQYVFPAVRVESMYKPSVYGVDGSIKQINVNAKH